MSERFATVAVREGVARAEWFAPSGLWCAFTTHQEEIVSRFYPDEPGLDAPTVLARFLQEQG